MLRPEAMPWRELAQAALSVGGIVGLALLVRAVSRRASQALVKPGGSLRRMPL